VSAGQDPDEPPTTHTRIDGDHDIFRNDIRAVSRISPSTRRRDNNLSTPAAQASKNP
jgi:hypothetical protein